MNNYKFTSTNNIIEGDSTGGGNLLDFLWRHAESNAASFHMPGHKGGKLYKYLGCEKLLESIYKCDITEIEGADNLFQPEGPILDLMESYRRLYGAEAAYVLVNGSSSGLMASIWSSVKEGDKVLLGSNCHQSVINGLRIAGATPIFLEPEKVDEFNCCGKISAEAIERGLKAHPDCKVVIITSPNYYGITSPIKEISRLVHKKGGILIVDQAHGAHLKWLMPQLSAEEGGADLVVCSTHKTLGSFTQSALLLVMSNKIDLGRLEDGLEIFQSSSPSYILMASLQLNCQIIEKHGLSLFKRWSENISWFLNEIKHIKNVEVLDCEGLDFTKLNIRVKSGNGYLDGRVLEKKLRENEIFTELYCDNTVMALTGIGNERKDYERLLDALIKIGSNCENESKELVEADELIFNADKSSLKNTDEFSLKNAEKSSLKRNDVFYDRRSFFDADGEDNCKVIKIPKLTKLVHYKDAVGKVAGKNLVPYPPGIPVVCAGQIYKGEVLEELFALRKKGMKILGMTAEGLVYIGCDIPSN